MLDSKFIREHVEEVKQNIERRRLHIDVDLFLTLDEARVALLQNVEGLRRERNEIADRMKNVSADERPALIQRGKELKEQLAQQEALLSEKESACQEILLQIPNMTHPDVAIGASDEDNVETKQIGKVVPLSFTPKSHVALGEALDVLDFQRGAKVSGTKFYFLKGKLALLEQALTQWTLQAMTKEGYIPIITPDVARNEVLIGTGYNPRGDEQQIYSLQNTDLSLIATAEIPIGGYHMDEMIDEEKFPLKYVGLSHAFRMEGGAYGRESYGLYRVHQFSKVELFIFSTPEQSEALHQELRRLEEYLFTSLGLTFRVVDICTGDLGGPAYRKYDLEAWMWGKGEGKGGWGEVTSASNCTDYQARRLNVKVRRKDGSLEYAHTLNGTAMAMSRALIAIMEQYQQADGSILVPEVLRPYCGFDRIG